MKVAELIDMLGDFDPESEDRFSYNYGDYWRTTVAKNPMNVESGVVKPTREEVLDAFAVEPQHDRTILERYLKQYPEYASELVKLSREVSRNIESDQNPLSAHEDRLINDAWLRHMELVC